jgi:membrane-associated protein
LLAVAVLWAAAVAGDALNFAVGQRAAPAVLRWLHGRWLRPQHLAATEAYFARYGAVTIVIARFVPIVRTLAPFLAGAGRMPYGRFALFNLLGGGLWVVSLVTAGYFLGNLPWVRAHLSQVTLAVVAVSLLPLVHAAWRARQVRRQTAG